MKYGTAALTFVFLVLFFGCSSPQNKAKEKLAQMGMEFSEKNFFDSVVNGNLDAVRLFLAAGMLPDVQDQGLTALIEAARRGYADIALELIQAGADVNAKDTYGVTALMFACISGSLKVVPKLIKKGAEIKAKDRDGRTALIEALSTENTMSPEIIQALIKAGADVNVKIADGLTPLMIAASGDPRMLRMLIDAGADVNAKDNNGASVLRRAKDNPGNIQVLKAAGARE